AHEIRNFCDRQNKIGRWIVLIKVDEVFEHGQGLMLGCVGEANTGARPAPAKTVGTFAIEWGARIIPAQHPVHKLQLMPPYAIRPRTFSTCRAPNSVSI